MKPRYKDSELAEDKKKNGTIWRWGKNVDLNEYVHTSWTNSSGLARRVPIQVTVRCVFCSKDYAGPIQIKLPNTIGKRGCVNYISQLTSNSWVRFTDKKEKSTFGTKCGEIVRAICLASFCIPISSLIRVKRCYPSKFQCRGQSRFQMEGLQHYWFYICLTQTAFPIHPL